MRVLFIGGTGFISGASSRLLIETGCDLYILNRGQRPTELAGATFLRADIRQPDEVRAALGDPRFDAVLVARPPYWRAAGATGICT